jgi:hypothetical protein
MLGQLRRAGPSVPRLRYFKQLCTLFEAPGAATGRAPEPRDLMLAAGIGLGGQTTGTTAIA